MDMFFGSYAGDLAIDLGTANTLVSVRGKGIVIREPSVVAIDKNDERILAVGIEAKRMLGRTPGNIVAVRPLKDGVIADFDITANMLENFLKKACGNSMFSRPRVVICIPSGVTEAISVDMGCVGKGLQCTERQVSICAKDSVGPYSYEVVGKLIDAARREKADYAVDVYPHYGSDVEATLSAGNDLRHGLIGAGVYASHGYERSHIDGVWNTLKVLKGYLEI